MRDEFLNSDGPHSGPYKLVAAPRRSGEVSVFKQEEREKKRCYTV